MILNFFGISCAGEVFPGQGEARSLNQELTEHLKETPYKGP